MAEADNVGRYPHATPEGDPIPFEIVRPLGLIVQNFTDVAINNIAIPIDADYLVLRADVPCLIQLTPDVPAALPADGVYTPGLVFVDGGDSMVVDHNAATEFSVIRFTDESGVIIVQTMTKYKDIRKAAQMERA